MESLITEAGLGVVIKDIEMNSLDIDVVPIADLPNVSGKIKDYAPIFTSIEEVKLKPSLVAVWYTRGNRVTPPTVREGEVVQLYRVKGTSIWGWEQLFTQHNLRRKEFVKTVISNIPVGKKGLVDDTSSVFFSVDTINGYIHLHTPTNDKELAGFDLTIDMRKGVLLVKDTKNNSINWDAVLGKLETTFKNEVVINTTKTTINSKTYVNGDTFFTGTHTQDGDTQNNGDVTTSGHTQTGTLNKDSHH